MVLELGSGWLAFVPVVAVAMQKAPSELLCGSRVHE